MEKSIANGSKAAYHAKRNPTVMLGVGPMYSSSPKVLKIMRILLQQQRTGLYFKEGGSWTRDAGEAVDFLNSTKAIDFCMANGITGAQFVLKFDEQLYDIVLPMVADTRRAAPTPRQTL